MWKVGVLVVCTLAIAMTAAAEADRPLPSTRGMRAQGSLPPPPTKPNPSTTPMPTLMATTAVKPISTAGTEGQFVSWSKAMQRFQLNGKKFVPVGFNAYWLGYTEEYTYPSKVQATEIFKAAAEMGATVIRSHTLGFSTGTAKSLRPRNNKLNSAAWEPIDYAFYQASVHGIKLICPLTDAYNWYHGNYGDFCKTRGVSKSKFWTDKNVRKDFKRYIFDWLNHVNSFTGVAIKNSPELFIIELGNELGDLSERHGSTTLPTKEWIADISSYIKTIDSKHLVMSGSNRCLGSKTSADFDVESIDVFSSHFYETSYTRVDYGANRALSHGKPFIIGEYGSFFTQSWLRQIEKRKNVKGTAFWSMYPHNNGLPSGKRIPHDDGWTIWYDAGSESQLIVLSNHFRRMRGLPPVQSLHF